MARNDVHNKPWRHSQWVYGSESWTTYARQEKQVKKNPISKQDLSFRYPLRIPVEEEEVGRGEGRNGVFLQGP